MQNIPTQTALPKIPTASQPITTKSHDSKETIDPVTVCKHTLQNIAEFVAEKNVYGNSLGEQFLWEIPEWEQLHANLNTAFLEDATSCMQQFSELCENHGIKLNELRPTTKSMERVKTKFEGMAKYAESSGKPLNYFKVVSDFAAATVYSPVHEIENTVARFQDLAKVSGGWCAVRGLGQDSYGYHKKGAEFKDIVQYLFVYLPEVGHVVEIQLGHPFARETFKRDSFLRENKNNLAEDQLPVDLWGDFNSETKKSEHDLYNEVKHYLLLQANQPADSALPEMKTRCMEVATNLFSCHSERQPMSPEFRIMLEQL